MSKSPDNLSVGKLLTIWKPGLYLCQVGRLLRPQLAPTQPLNRSTRASSRSSTAVRVGPLLPATQPLQLLKLQLLISPVLRLPPWIPLLDSRPTPLRLTTPLLGSRLILLLVWFLPRTRPLFGLPLFPKPLSPRFNLLLVLSFASTTSKTM